MKPSRPMEGSNGMCLTEFMNLQSDRNGGKKYYKKIECPSEGFLRIIPTTGALFEKYFHGGIEYGPGNRMGHKAQVF